MTKELRRLSIIVVFMFVALFAATSFIQVVGASALDSNANNKRTLYDSFDVQRGSIIAGGQQIVTSSASHDVYVWQREYVDPQLWSPITGWMNPALQSVTGLESAMNAELSGRSDSAFFSRVEQIITGQDPKGSSIEISLDPAAQRAAVEAMGQLTGAAVAIEPATGRILAMVSTPGFDANAIATHNTSAANTSYESAEPNVLNRAISDVQPPGSTFKLVVASAALSSGKYTMDSTFPNVVGYTLPGSSSVVRNSSRGLCGAGGETVTLHDAIRFSCNVPMAELAVKLGEQAIRDEAEKFGFNSTFTTPLATVSSSYPMLGGDKAQAGLSGFGQGKVTATPLQVAMIAAGIANKGTVMNPKMVDSVIGPDLSVQQTFGPSALSEAISPEIAAAVTKAMVASVTDGAATNARIDGVTVAGKTGTAERGGDRPYTLWFTGFAPAEDPKVAVAVMVEDGGGQGQSGSGNTIAAPVAKKIMEAVLNR